MVKRIFTAVLALCLIMLTVTGLVSCGRPPEYAEIEDRFIELVEASYEINEVLFGKGLPTDERIYDPWDSMEIYERKDDDGNALIGSTGKPLYGYYCYFEDKQYGELLAYRDGATAPTVYLSVSRDEIAEKTPVYKNAEKGLYYYSSDYKPKDGIRYYGKNDPVSYDYVSAESKYFSIDAIKAAAEEIYSKDYLNSSVYEGLFTGVASVDEVNKLEGLSARYIEYMNAQAGDTVAVLMQSNTYPALVSETRKYDFSTARVIKPGSKKLVNIEIESYLESAPEQRATVKITMVLVDGEWYLDSGTY